MSVGGWGSCQFRFCSKSSSGPAGWVAESAAAGTAVMAVAAMPQTSRCIRDEIRICSSVVLFKFNFSRLASGKIAIPGIFDKARKL